MSTKHIPLPAPRIDARGWWRSGPVRITPQPGMSPAERAGLVAFIVDACNNHDRLTRELAEAQARETALGDYLQENHPNTRGYATAGIRPGEAATKVIDALRTANEKLRAAIQAAANELGVAQPGYPAPVVNACNILLAALSPQAEGEKAKP